MPGAGWAARIDAEEVSNVTDPLKAGGVIAGR